jgi:3-oxoacyl-[acyl-carrier protein] reductase
MWIIWYREITSYSQVFRLFLGARLSGLFFYLKPLFMKRLVMTGGSGGVGSAIRGVFDTSDWNVVSPRRNELDHAKIESIKPFFEDKDIDLLICAAGEIGDHLLFGMTESEWDKIYSINYLGAAKCAAAVLPKMIEAQKGHIVFISSYSALHPPSGQAAYASAKAALIGLAKALAIENGIHGIRVNVILPGFLETQMTSSVSNQRKKQIQSDHCLRRFNRTLAVAKFIRFLDESLPDTSGQVFQLDSRISQI